MTDAGTRGGHGGKDGGNSRASSAASVISSAHPSPAKQAGSGRCALMPSVYNTGVPACPSNICTSPVRGHGELLIRIKVNRAVRNVRRYMNIWRTAIACSLDARCRLGAWQAHCGNGVVCAPSAVHKLHMLLGNAGDRRRCAAPRRSSPPPQPAWSGCRPRTRAPAQPRRPTCILGGQETSSPPWTPWRWRSP